MTAKKLIFVLFVGVILTGGLFAEGGLEKGFVRATTNVGILFAPGGGGTITVLETEADFINKYGIDFVLGTGMIFTDDMAFFMKYGFGYTFHTPRWCLGVKVIGLGFGDNGTGGFNISGSYFFTDYIGLTLGLDAYVFNEELFAAKVGISLKI